MAHVQQRLFVEEVKNKYPEFFKNKKVLECGSLDINGSTRDLFTDCDYIGVDLGEGKNVDIISKVHELSFNSKTFDIVYSCEMLEHDQYWKQSLLKMFELLKEDGLLFFTCAANGRPEHGTERTDRYSSPFTSSIKGWENYYKNMAPDDIKQVLRLRNFSDTLLRVEGSDLQFCAIKKKDVGLVYDSFLFFDEQELLDIRLNSLKPYVDKFVILESNRTFSGKPKPYYFDLIKDQYTEFPIIHVKDNDEYKDNPKLSVLENSWKREFNQRIEISYGIKDTTDKDTILLSDIDEIPNLKDWNGTLGAFKQKFYYYYLNTRANEEWFYGTVAINKEMIESIGNLEDVRKLRYKPDFLLPIMGGWHYSTLGPLRRIYKKIEAFSHQEHNTPETKKALIERFNNLIDPYGRFSTPMKIEELSGPDWLLENQFLFGDLVYKESKTFVKKTFTFKPREDGRPTIALAMIVKNEEEILENCINSVKNIIDEFVIVDTGSTDRTKEIINKYGNLYEIPFENYVDTKNKALDLVKADYVLWMDADERIYQGLDKLVEFVKSGVDCVACPITEGPNGNDSTVYNTYLRNRIWKNNGKWKFDGPYVHEVCVGDGKIITSHDILVRHEHLKSDKKSTSTERFTNYIKLLKEYIGKFGEKGKSYPRALFYLARTLKDLGRNLEAVEYYQKYLEVPNNNFRDERWQAAYDASLCLLNSTEYEQAHTYIEKAIEIDERRAENYSVLSLLNTFTGSIEESWEIGKKAIREIPEDVILFLNPMEYNIIPLDKLSLIGYQLHKYDECYNMSNELLKLCHGKENFYRVTGNMWWFRKKKYPKVFMLLGNIPEPIYGGILNDRGVHGLETTYLELSEELSKLGCDVFLFSNIEEEHVYNNVYYIPYKDLDKYLSIEPDVVITSRDFDLDKIKGAKFLWMQDALFSGAENSIPKIHRVVCSSDWHKKFLLSKLGMSLYDKIDVIPLGIRKDWFDFNVDRKPYKVMYTSSPDRGLDSLLDMWNRITENTPDIELSIVYGWDSSDSWGHKGEQKTAYDSEKRRVIDRIKQFSNISLTGRITKKELYKHLKESRLVLYPSHFWETFCLSALEAQTAGTPLVTSNIGALQNVVNPKGNIVLFGSSYSEEYRERYIREVKNLFNSKTRIENLSKENLNYIKNLDCDWSDIGKKWIEYIWKII